MALLLPIGSAFAHYNQPGGAAPVYRENINPYPSGTIDIVALSHDENTSWGLGYYIYGPCSNITDSDSSTWISVHHRALDAQGGPTSSYALWGYINQGTSSCANNVREGGMGVTRTTPEIQWQFRSSNGSVVYQTAATKTPGDIQPKAIAPTNLRVGSMGGGGKVLTYDHMAALAIRTGWSREQSVIATAVAMGESSGRTHAVSYTGCCWGIWQINGEVHPYSKAQMFDAYQNVVAAKKIWDDAGGSWQPWQAYTGPDGSGSDGPWLSFKSSAQAAVDRQMSNGQAAYATIPSAPQETGGYVELLWGQGSGPAANQPTSYTVQKSTDGGASWSAGWTTNNLSFTDATVSLGSTYRYRVKGTRSQHTDSDWSNVVEVTIGQSDPDGDATVPSGGAAHDDVDPNGGAYDENGVPVACSQTVAPSNNCGLSMICYMKAALRWAFVPGQTTCEQWEQFQENLATKPPFSLAMDGAGMATEVYGDVKTQYEQSVAGGGENLCLDVGAAVEPLEGAEPGCISDSLRSMAEAFWVSVLRTITMFGIYIGALLVIWKIMKSAFSSTPEVEGGELRLDAEAVKDA